MPDEGSVSILLQQLREGGMAAAAELWRRYFGRLVALARTKLHDAPRRAADEEDVALSAFDSFCRHAEAGRFPDLDDRDGLWALLVVLTARKAARLRRNETRLKRGGGVIADELREAISREPGPETAAIAAEEHRRLMEALGDDGLRRVAQLRLEGHAVEEIAALAGFAPRSIKRKLALIREAWAKELAD